MAAVARPHQGGPWDFPVGPGSPTLARARATEPPRAVSESVGKTLGCSEPSAASTAPPPPPPPSASQKEADAKQREKLQRLQDISARISAVMEDVKATKGQHGISNLLPGPGMQIGGFGPPVRMGDEYLMTPRKHGTSSVPVQEHLRWDCNRKLADRICNFNRRGAEDSGYFVDSCSFLQEAPAPGTGEVTFCDSNTGRPLFFAPRGRSFEEFLKESRLHGWLSFRDSEVNWDLVRVLPDGETVSVHGTHLGHCLPDASGHRFCINVVSVAGRPKAAQSEGKAVR